MARINDLAQEDSHAFDAAAIRLAAPDVARDVRRRWFALPESNYFYPMPAPAARWLEGLLLALCLLTFLTLVFSIVALVESDLAFGGMFGGATLVFGGAAWWANATEMGVRNSFSATSGLLLTPSRMIRRFDREVTIIPREEIRSFECARTKSREHARLTEVVFYESGGAQHSMRLYERTIDPVMREGASRWLKGHSPM